MDGSTGEVVEEKYHLFVTGGLRSGCSDYRVGAPCVRAGALGVMADRSRVLCRGAQRNPQGRRAGRPSSKYKILRRARYQAKASATARSGRLSQLSFTRKES